MTLSIDDVKNSKRYFNTCRELENADTIFLSFPKSGRTWVRNVLGEYLHIKYNVPFNQHLNSTNPDKRLIRTKQGCPLISFTHDYYSLERSNYKKWDVLQQNTNEFLFLEFYQNLPTIILLRDPIDCMVSFYHMHYYYTVNPYTDSMYSWFVESQFNLDYTCKWFDLLFKQIEYMPKKLIVHYEDLKSDTTPWKKIIEFVTNDCDQDILDLCLNNNSFDVSQNKEIQEKLDKGIVVKSKDKLFVRNGGNNYVDDLETELKNYIINHERTKQIQTKILNAKT